MAQVFSSVETRLGFFQGDHGSVRFGYGSCMEPFERSPVFDSEGSSGKGFLGTSAELNKKARFQVWFLKYGSDGSSSSLGSWRNLSGHYSPDWSEYVNVIGVISEPFAHEFR